MNVDIMCFKPELRLMILARMKIGKGKLEEEGERDNGRERGFTTETSCIRYLLLTSQGHCKLLLLQTCTNKIFKNITQQ